MRILLQRGERNQGFAGRQAEPFLGAAIGALRPDGLNQPQAIVRRRAGAERPPQVGSGARVEAHQPDAVGGQPAAVAIPAEGLRGRRDDPEGRAVRQGEAVGGCGAAAAERLHGAVAGFDDLQHFRLRDDRVAPPPRRPAHVHVLDEPDLGADVPAVLDQLDQLVLVGAAHHDRVDLEGLESGAGCRVDAGEDRRVRVEAGQRFEAAAVQRVEADGDAVQPGIAQRGGLLGEQHAIGRQREIRDAGQPGQLGNEDRQIAAQQRLAAGHPDAVHPDRHERGRKGRNLLEREQRVARQPGVVVLRHAVVAPEVAAVGDRHTQAAERPPETIGNGDSHRETLIITCVLSAGPRSAGSRSTELGGHRRNRLVGTDFTPIVRTALRVFGPRTADRGRANTRRSSMSARRGFVVLALVGSVVVAPSAQDGKSAGGAKADPRLDRLKTDAAAAVDGMAVFTQQMVDQIFSYGELGFQEQETHRYLVDILKKNGFSVEDGIAGIPTAFMATWGSGKPVIALGSDIDGIPQSSQKPGVAYHDPLIEGAPGHGEGHNSGQAVNITAAIAVKKIMEREKLPGTIRIWPGTAEELVGTKAHFVRAGFFKDVDVALFTHVSNDLSVTWGDRAGTGLVSVEYSFRGETAHSAGAPWRGRSALDAVELMNIGWNYRREHLPLEHRSHYVITQGGDQPNVVPRSASVWYYLRHTSYPRIKELWKIGDDMAKAAALMTGVELLPSRVLGTAWPQHFNKTIAEVTYANIQKVGMPKWSDADQTLAKALQQELGSREEGLSLTIPKELQGPVTDNRGGGSDDIGDISWNVPTVTLRYPANI